MILTVLLSILLGIVAGLLPGLNTPAALLLIYGLLASQPPWVILLCYFIILTLSQYLGSVASIYTGVPGDTSSWPSAIEGPKLVQQGRGPEAISLTALGSFFAGTTGLILFLLGAPILIHAYTLLGSALQLTILLLTFSVIVVTSENKLIINLILVIIAVLISTVGYNSNTNETYFTAGIYWLRDGIPWEPLVVGSLLGSASSQLLKSHTFIESISRLEVISSIKNALVYRWLIIRHTLLGFLFGLIPGLSYVLSSSLSYTLEKNQQKNYQAGNVKCLLASETANNAGSVSSLMPFLLLGVPITASEAVAYNLFSIGADIRQLMATVSGHWPLALLSVILVNLFGVFVSWRFSDQLIRVYSIPRKYLVTILFFVGIITVWVATKTYYQQWMSIWVFAFTWTIFYRWARINVIPFIFTLMIYDYTARILYSVYQLYF